jgi:Spy/CpxP family protein refolding chaperone
MNKQISLPSATRGTLFEILKRTVICHWSFVIGEKNNIQKPPLIGRGCQPPAPLDPPQKLLIIFTRVSLCLRAFVAIFFMLLFSQLAIAQSTEMEKQLEKLTQKLNLSEEQTTKAREIFQEVQMQKAVDRQTYKTDALALIQAAWTRRNFVDNKIEPILDSQQLEEYKALGKLHPVDRELFVLTEGLLLNDEQIFDVEGILIRLHNEYGQLSELMEMMGAGGGKPGGPGGGGIGIGPGGGRGGMGMPMGRGGGMMANMMKKIEAKKAKAIKKLLTDEQKELYEQIRKDRRQKMKEQMKRMKERRKKE